MVNPERDNRPAPPAGFEITHPLRPLILASILSLVLFIISAVILSVIFIPTLPLARTLPLALFVFGLTGLWAVLSLVMLARRPTAQELVEVWGLAARVVIYGCHFACIWLIWGILPFGTLDAQLITMMLLTAYVPTQIICSPENVTANRVGIITVLGSAAAFLATRGTTQTTMLAIYMAAYALVMFILSDRVRHTMQASVTARLTSDAAACELERLLEEVAEEKDAKTRFIMAASHDLGQPLQAAALFFDQTLRAPNESTRARAADGVRRAFTSAEQLLSHMLNHLRLEADAVEPHLSRVALAPLLNRIAAQHGPAALAAKIDIRVLPHGSALLLDPVLMERAVGNLIHNAIHHSRGTRLLLAVRRRQGQAVRIWVIDNGVGISTTDAKHIFEDYYQGATTGAGLRVGFGLGLSSVLRIARLMGGEAGLDPRWRRGAAFYLEFPEAGVLPPGARAEAPANSERFFK